MQSRGQKRLRSTLALMGTIIGAGIFGIPAMIGAWGVIPATLGFIVLTLAVLATHLFYAEAVLRYKPDVRMSGFAGHWLGPAGAAVGGMGQTLQVFGSNLAYLILGGEFLALLGRDIGIQLPVLTWQIIFWAGGALSVMVGLALLSRIQAFLTWALIGTMLLITGSFLGHLDLSVVWRVPMGWSFEPYGVFLYSLFGLNVIPELEKLVGGRRDDLRATIIRGTLGSAFLMYLFGISAWLASSGSLGRNPTDLIAFLPPVFMVIIPLFGFLAVVTSLIPTAFDLGSMFELDFKLSKPVAWIVALGTPLVLLLLTARDFLSTIGLVGSVFGAMTAITAVLSGRAALRSVGKVHPFTRSWWWQEVVPVVLSILFVAGGLSWLFVA